MKTITKSVLFILILLSPLFLKGTHIIGGTAGFRIINVENEIATAQIDFYLYRDASGPAQFDDPIEIGLYGFVNEEYQFISKQTINLSHQENINFDDIDGCDQNNFAYSFGVYSFQIDIPTIGYDYYTLSYQRCCRDNTLTNIQFPEMTGIAITLDIYPGAFETQETIFPLKTSFPVQVEPGQETSFDISIEDSFDKKYYLSAPKASGGILGSSEPGDPFSCQGIVPDPENCLPDYADVLYVFPEQPYGEGAAISLDEDSGELNVDIPLISKILVGVTLDRFEDNELICRMRQQFIINSVSCDPLSHLDTGSEEFAVSPNPAREIIQFNIPIKQVIIKQMNGAEVMNLAKTDFVTEIKVNDFPDGIYFLQGQTSGGEWVSKKIVILN